jgi:hypothetical protein
MHNVRHTVAKSGTYLKVALLLILTGCGAPNVSIQRAEFAIMYADTKAQVSVWMYRVEQGCHAKKLSPETCSELPQVRLGLTLLDEQAKAMLRQADREPNWAMIQKYVEIAINLASKAM